MFFPSAVYDRLKWVALILLPALGTAYFALSGFWDWPNSEAVVGTIVVVDTFLGAILGISNSQYKNSDEKYDGSVGAHVDVANDETNLKFNVNPADLINKDEVLLKVNKRVN